VTTILASVVAGSSTGLATALGVTLIRAPSVLAGEAGPNPQKFLA